MKEKTLNKIKNFWSKNGGKIKTGLICGTVGVMYGTIKGANTATRIIMEDAYRAGMKDSDTTPKEAEDEEDVTITTF